MSDYAKLAANLISDPELFLSDMTAMLRDIRDGKLVVVPAEPTEAMINVGVAAYEKDGQDSHMSMYHCVCCAYRAMLAASQEKP